MLETPRPRLWRRRPFGGPREWHGWTIGVLRIGPWVLMLRHESRDPDWHDPFGPGFVD